MIPPGSPPNLSFYEIIKNEVKLEIENNELRIVTISKNALFADKECTIKAGYRNSTSTKYKDNGAIYGELYESDFILDYSGSLHFATPEKISTPPDYYIDKIISGDKAFQLANGFKVSIGPFCDIHYIYFDEI